MYEHEYRDTQIIFEVLLHVNECIVFEIFVLLVNYDVPNQKMLFKKHKGNNVYVCLTVNATFFYLLLI